MFKRKKGFTLVEMLVVIAIIAILVSIMIPVIGKSTTKAAAATNAANLRSVQGAITVMRVSDEDAFSKEQETEANWEELYTQGLAALRKLGTGDLSWSDIGNVVTSFVNLIVDSANENVVYYAEDGVITIGDYTIDAPGAKALSIEGYEIQENTQMCVLITENDVIASYAGVPTGCFAIIAEDGESADMSGDETHHYSDNNSDSNCDICGKPIGEHTTDQITGGMNDDLNTGGHTCHSSDNDHKCDDPDCSLSVTCPNDTNNDCACDNCGKTTHTFTPETGCGADENKCAICGHSKENGCKAH